MISSATDVKIIGASAVPLANNLPPRAIKSAVAFGPEPACPLMIVPASMVNSTPDSTVTRLAKTYTLSAVHVVFVVILFETITEVSSVLYLQELSSFSASILKFIAVGSVHPFFLQPAATITEIAINNIFIFFIFS